MGWWWLAAPAAGYTFATDPGGDPMRWPAFPVAYAPAAGSGLDGVDDAALRDEVDRAFAAWADVDAVAVRFAAEAARGPLEVRAEAPNLVYAVRDWPHDPELLALTSLWADGEGRIVAYDLQINADRVWSVDGDPDRFDVRAAVTHEVGHALGLEHSLVPEAAMYATSMPGEVWRRVLHADDEAAVRVLYPFEARRGAPDAPLACATGVGPGSALALLLALSSLRSRRTP